MAPLDYIKAQADEIDDPGSLKDIENKLQEGFLEFVNRTNGIQDAASMINSASSEGVYSLGVAVGLMYAKDILTLCRLRVN